MIVVVLLVVPETNKVLKMKKKKIKNKQIKEISWVALIVEL